MLRKLFASVLLILLPAAAHAAGHGPVFGAATPTLGRGGWSFDQAWTGRFGDGTDSMLRTMVTFGVTETIEVSGSVPISLDRGRLPAARTMSLMSGNEEVEGLVGWRFHRKPVGLGGRFESTLFAGGTIPTRASRDGVKAGRSLYAAATTGFASRAHYFWGGAGYQRYGERDRDRLGDSTFLSIVYGYRPPALRWDYPRPDLRFFVEGITEIAGRAQRTGIREGNSGGRTVLIGPTTLLLYKAYGIEGGVLFPVFQDLNGTQAREHVRAAVNFTYFFWLK